MGKTAKNPMSEDELFSALGLSASAAEPKKKPAQQMDGDLLIDILAPDSNAAKRTSADAARERAREEQEREMRLRSQEWKRELEQQQMRDAAMAAAAEEERAEREQASRAKSQPIIPNMEEMRDIEDVATMADEKRRAADEVERRRLAMREQVRRRQEEVAAEAQAAAEQARRRAQENESVKQAAASQLAAQQRSQSNQMHQSKPLAHEPEAKRQMRVNQQPRNMGKAQERPASRSAQLPNRNVRDPRASADIMRQRPQGYSQNLGNSAPVQKAPRSEARPEPAPERQAAPPAYQQQAPQPERAPRPQDAPKRQAPKSPQSKESPLGIVLIVLAVLCVLVAASLLTGLWDISNL